MQTQPAFPQPSPSPRLEVDPPRPRVPWAAACALAVALLDALPPLERPQPEPATLRPVGPRGQT